MEKVSVIIPANNRAKFTSEALESVFTQKGNYVLEVIVVDDRSKPPLKSLLSKSFPDVKFIRNNTRYFGPAASRNIGLKKSTGKYVAFLDNDDKWKSDFLKKSITVIKRNKSSATVCLTDQYFYGKFPLFRKFKLVLLNFIRLTSLLLSFAFNGERVPRSAFYLCQLSHMVFDRKHINKIKFNEQSQAAEDWEFNLDASLHRSISIIPEKLTRFRYVLKSITFSKNLLKNKEKAYSNLISKIPKSYKHDIFYYLFIVYFKLFLVK